MAQRCFIAAAFSLVLVAVSLAQSAGNGENDGSAVFNPEEIKSLYEKTKANNAKLAAVRPDHLNEEKLELFEINSLLVEGKRFKLPTELSRKIDPYDLENLGKRFERIDPAEANMVRWYARTNAEFFLGTYDNTGALGRGEGRMSTGITIEQLTKLLQPKPEKQEEEPQSMQR